VIGFLMLDTDFARPPGDIGHPDTFDFPVRYEVVRGARTDRIVADASRARDMLPNFIEAAQRLEREGVQALTTSCGFLAVFQREISASVSIPFVASSLALIPVIRIMIAPRPFGIVTAHSGYLSTVHLGEDVAQATPIIGLEDKEHFRAAILGSADEARVRLDPTRIEQEVLDACRALTARSPDIGAFLFECTNLQPYAHAIQRELGLPVFGMNQVVAFLNAGVSAPSWVVPA